MSRSRAVTAFSIVAMCIVAAIAYGIAHDLVTAHVCVEYFTIGHPPVFGTDSPLLLALGWGVIATWWVGLMLGLVLAFAAVRGARPMRTARSLLRPVALLLLVMAVCAALAGGIGYFAGGQGWVFLLEPLASRVPSERHVLFLADLWAHSASYLVGFVGGLVLAGRVWRSRRAATLGPSATSP
ncbi:MAG: hypothetical protein H6835_16955 [Planctomycetes bacterium]|nr:hypothetical protein [Planctomycetota bacterium]